MLKGFDQEGFVFYTNLESRKGQDLAVNAHAAICLHWKSLRRQIRVEGETKAVTAEEADAYFASRPRGSQIGAWASSQSRPLGGRFELERRVGNSPPSSAWGPSRARRIGRDFASCRVIWNSGRIVPSGCMTAWSMISQARMWTTERLYP